jgi:hypothetical protein
LGRLGRLGLERPLRYERSRPGELLHIEGCEQPLTRVERHDRLGGIIYEYAYAA